MQKRFTLLTVCGILASLIVLSVAGIVAQDVGTSESATTSSSSNLLVNGGFESDANADSVPDGFKFMRQDVRLSTDARSGSKSIMFEDNTTTGKSPFIESEEFIPVDTSKTYELSGYAKSSSGQQMSYLGLVFFGADKKPVYFYNSTGGMVSYYNYPAIVSNKLTTAWKLYSGNITGESNTLNQHVFPVGAKFAKVRAFGVYRTDLNYSQPGKVWMDDLQLVQVTNVPPAPNPSNNSNSSGGGNKNYSAGELISITTSTSASVSVGSVSHTISLVTTSSSTMATIKVDGVSMEAWEGYNYTFSGGFFLEIRNVVHPAYAGDTRKVELVVNSVIIRDACGDLSDSVKTSLGYLRGREDNRTAVIVSEGGNRSEKRYIVIGGRANKLLEVTNLQIDTATTGTVTFEDYISGDSQTVTLANSSGVYTKWVNFFGGQGFTVKVVPGTVGVTDKVSISWYPDNVIDTYNCVVPPIPSTCSDLINRVANPKSYERGVDKYTLWYNGSYKDSQYTKNSGVQDYTEYYAGWYMYSNTNNYITENVRVFDNSMFNASEIFESYGKETNCNIQKVYDSSGKVQSVGVCGWNYDQEVQYQYKSASRNIFWYDGNVFVTVSFSQGSWMSNEELQKVFAKKTDELISSLKNNNFESELFSLYDLSSIFSQELSDNLILCGSQVAQTTDSSGKECALQWSCKTEPVICPEYGYQTRVCEEFGCDTREVREERLYCSPGICSGCYVPRLFGSKTDNVCVPYGIRLESTAGDSDKVPEMVDLYSDGRVEANISIISNQKAYMYFANPRLNKVYFDEVVYVGGTYRLIIDDERDQEDVTFSVDKIVPGTNGEKGYLVITVMQSFNAYCDIDGDIKAQKEKQYNGEWASCQNNYECSSNFCSAGQCIEVQDMIKEASALKTFFVRVACRLTNPFDNTGYSRCLAENIGGKPIPSMSPPVDLSAQSNENSATNLELMLAK